MALVKWNDSFKLGIPEIDNQHKRLVDILNELGDSMINKSANEQLPKILAELIDYTRTHFTFEEKAQQKCGYPVCKSHKLKHDDFVKKVMELQEQQKKGKLMLSRDVMTFLKDWLVNHIQKEDRKYVPYMNKTAPVTS